MDNIMVDLETLDNGPTSAILSIGAVAFNEIGPGDEFYTVVKVKSCTDVGLTLNADTVMWWMQQSDAARAAFNNNEAMHLREALRRFEQFITSATGDPRKAKVWGNGATFDNVILANAYRASGLDRPWKYSNDRCYRTLKNLYPWVKGPASGAVKHNALEDARWQARHASSILAAMGNMTYGG